MQEWVGAHRGDAAGVDGAMLDSFASWVSERSKIAGQTVGTHARRRHVGLEVIRGGA